MMNPSARPWYPPGDVALGVQTPTVRRQNDPYNFSALQRPPTPLCGDSDLSTIQLESLAAALRPAPLPSHRKGPYRSTALVEQTAALADSTPPQLSPGTTTSSSDSRGDWQEIGVANAEETYCSAAARAVRPKVSIPLPRSQRLTDISPAAPFAPKGFAAAVIAANTSVATCGDGNAARASVPMNTGSTGHDSAAEAGTFVDAKGDDGRFTGTVSSSAAGGSGGGNDDDDDDDHESDDDDEDGDGTNDDDKMEEYLRSGSNEANREKKWRGCTGLPLATSASGHAAAAKKPKSKVKREDKWTIVQGKTSADLAGMSAVPLKKMTAVAAVVKVRENGAVVRLPDLQAADRTRSKQRPAQQQRQKEDDSSGKDEAIIEVKTRRQRDARRTRGASSDDELLESLANGMTSSTDASPSFTDAAGGAGTAAAVGSSSSSGGGCGEVPTPFAIMGVPLASVAQGEQLLPPSPVATGQKNAYRILLRSLAMSETSSAKKLLLQRALRGIPESSYHQCPELVCAILLETSDSCVDVERSLQTCYRALQLAEKHKLDTFEMLARLAITRTFARVIDTMDARVNLTRAAAIAIATHEKAALGWIAMQMGVTLEISGLFPESLAWYEAAERLASATGQHQLLCDICCCESIAYSAVGEVERAQRAYEASRALLPHIPRHRHQRPLQNYAQLKCQLGDMAAALRLQETELEIAKEVGDTHATARCMGAIALTKRFLCRYDEAAENHMEELCVHTAHDPRQAVESLTGAAACWRMGGHLQKAYDYCMRALRQAQQCQDLTTLAKALVELAEAELSLNQLDKAQQHLREALATVARVDEAEQKQYLVKAALCEVEWRCCSILEQVHFRRGEVFEALQCTDRCHVPNTAHVARLLLRRQRRAGVVLGSKDAELVSKNAIERFLRRPTMRGWRIVCYSLPWNEGLDFMAYVLHFDEDNGSLACVGRQLRMQDELVAFMCTPNALTKLFDAPMYTETGERIYGDTPLWPQMYSKVAFDFQQSADNAKRVESLRTDTMYCLRLLHDNFIAPLEADLCGAAGLMFVGDGVFSRLPFHALHDGTRHLAERFGTSICCSMALLCTHIAEEEREEQERHDAPERRCTVVDDASGSTVLLDACLAAAAAEEDACVRRVVVDANAAGSDATRADDEEADAAAAAAEATAAASWDVDVAATQQLLRSLHRRGKVTWVRNALYRAVHEAPGGVLELRLRALPEVKEDYCGAFVGASSDVIASHSSEVANTWELRSYALVVCSGVGTYSGLSIHETGIPTYRSLQYAGARRLLLATGSRVPSCDRVAAAAVLAAMRGSSVAAAVRGAYLRCIADRTPLEEWAGFTLVGLPT